MIPAAHQTGRLGESLAADYLEAHGYSILARNCRFGKAEVDIIATKGNFCCLVEVKTRAAKSLIDPQAAVSKQKQELMRSAADAFMSSWDRDVEVRFDIIAISKERNHFNIRHLKSAFYSF